MTIKRIYGVKVTGVLTQWRRKSELSIAGILSGMEVTLSLKYPLVHYPEGRETQEHYLARTISDNYYLLNVIEEKL